MAEYYGALTQRPFSRDNTRVARFVRQRLEMVKTDRGCFHVSTRPSERQQKIEHTIKH
jgi:hypothetical protein